MSKKLLLIAGAVGVGLLLYSKRNKSATTEPTASDKEKEETAEENTTSSPGGSGGGGSYSQAPSAPIPASRPGADVFTQAAQATAGRPGAVKIVLTDQEVPPTTGGRPDAVQTPGRIYVAPAGRPGAVQTSVNRPVIKTTTATPRTRGGVSGLPTVW